MSKHGELAADYFMKGYNCSQSVVAAFADDLGISEALALRVSSGFGGGVGRMREVCGAFTGLTTVVGLAYADANDPNDKSKIYDIVQQLAAQFKLQSGSDSFICKELLGLAKPEGTPQAEPRTDAYYKKRPCKELVSVAADIMADYMVQHPVEFTGH